MEQIRSKLTKSISRNWFQTDSAATLENCVLALVT